MKKSVFSRFGLEEHVREAVDLLGFDRPTAVQERVIPLMVQGRNLLVEAATGTGKTAAYGLPLISRLDLQKRSTQVLVIVPSRELATQVLTALRTFSVNPKLRVDAIFGGMTLAESEKKIKASPHVMVAVPGRLKDVLRSGKFDYFWRDIRHLVLDEADKLVEVGFQELMDSLLPNIRSTAHTALFSATLSKDARMLVEERFGDLIEIKLSSAEATRNISFYSVKAPLGAKEKYLKGLIEERKISHALIFCSHRKEVMPVAQFLRTNNIKAEAYHGMLDQTEREAVLRRFRQGMIHFLVATDLAARGLDIEELPAVIHYSWPESLEVFMHRSGRTGRAGNHGDCYALSSSGLDESNLLYFQNEGHIKIKPLVITLRDEKVEMDSSGGRWVKLHLNRGKRDKLRTGDIVGFLTQSFGASKEGLGTIALYADHTLVDVTMELARKLEGENEIRIKGKIVKVTRYSLDDRQKVEKAIRKKQIGVRDKKKEASRIEKKENQKLRAGQGKEPLKGKKETREAPKTDSRDKRAPKVKATKDKSRNPREPKFSDKKGKGEASRTQKKRQR